MNNLLDERTRWLRMIQSATTKPVVELELNQLAEIIHGRRNLQLEKDVEAALLEATGKTQADLIRDMGQVSEELGGLTEPIKSNDISNPNPNELGYCSICHKHRRLWAGVCGWCGADPEDFED